MEEELAEDRFHATNDASISWLDEGCEVGTEEDNLDVHDHLIMPFVSTEVVEEQKDLPVHLLHSCIEFLHHIGKHLACHPGLFVVEIPKP